MFWNIALVDWLKILAPLIGTLASPLIALWIGGILARRRERRDRRYQVFMRLMGDRAVKMFDAESVRLLNSIDVIFSDNKRVRDAYGSFFNAVTSFKIGQDVSVHEVESLRIDLLRAMSEDLRMGRQLSNSDFYRQYQPEHIFQKSQIELVETQKRFNELQAEMTSPAIEARPMAAPVMSQRPDASPLTPLV
jgi:hypothetical protein